MEEVYTKEIGNEYIDLTEDKINNPEEYDLTKYDIATYNVLAYDLKAQLNTWFNNACEFSLNKIYSFSPELSNTYNNDWPLTIEGVDGTYVEKQKKLMYTISFKINSNYQRDTNTSNFARWTLSEFYRLFTQWAKEFSFNDVKFIRYVGSVSKDLKNPEEFYNTFVAQVSERELVTKKEVLVPNITRITMWFNYLVEDMKPIGIKSFSEIETENLTDFKSSLLGD